MEVRAWPVANSYHAEVTTYNRDTGPGKEPIWKCSHEHTEYAEAVACAEAEIRRRFTDGS